VGIVGYGSYIPRFRLPASEIARVWKGEVGALPLREKTVPGLDEDTVTMSIEAARNALQRAQIDPRLIRAVWVGSESHPYAVKPTSTIVAEAIETSSSVQAGDWEFACKAGSEAIVAAVSLVGSDMADYALAIGMDTAQGRPGDELEYTAAAGGAAFILGPSEKSVAVFEASYSYVTDTPDFWRRPRMNFPSHGFRFTGEPAYFRHITAAAEQLLNGLGRSASDYDHAVFHQPNSKFPQRVAARLGFSREQIAAGLLVADIGNVYAGSSLVGLSAVLDVAEPGQRVLLVSFGSGAGSDAISWEITDRIGAARNRAPTTQDYVRRRKELDYGVYVRYRRKLHTK
jgi:hydroxymethylglutaryl-CoA synthase